MNISIRRPTLVKQWATAAISALMITALSVAAAAHVTNHVSIATVLTEVQRGTFDGRDYLTLHIGGHEVGPSSCRSNVLRMDTGSQIGAQRQEEIEAIALSAMLSADTVMIVVPLDTDQCVDGKPTFTDLYLLPASL